MPALTRNRLAALASACLIALIMLGLAWELWLAPLRPGGSWLVLKIVPLLGLLFGILHGRPRTYGLASLLIWFYFAEGVMRVMTEAPPAAYLAGAEIVLSLALFGFIALFLRTRKDTGLT